MFLQDVAPPEPCVSLVIHGRLLEQNSEPIPEVDPDEIVIRWPWRLTLRVDDVVLGQFDGDRLKAVGFQHTEIREDYGRTFLFGRMDQGYALLTISPRALSRRQDLAVVAAEAGTQLCDVTNQPAG